jgi:ribonuclease BN (tRNA processing enzyme)
LKYGFSVQTEDGSRTVQPEEVWKPMNKRARKITIAGDNRGWTSQMTEIAQDSDVLVHEATLVEENYSVSLSDRRPSMYHHICLSNFEFFEQRGHSTAAMAGKISGDVNASLLLLNHISSKSDRADRTGKSNLIRLMDDARKTSKGKSEVLVAYDFMEVLVPRIGFGNKHLENCSLSETIKSTANSKKEDRDNVETRAIVKNWFDHK